MASGQSFVAQGVSRRFGATQALEDVSFSVRKGEIHAVLGENGAGKSTLVKILSGYLQPDSGNLELDGALFEAPNPKATFDRGIVVVH